MGWNLGGRDGQVLTISEVASILGVCSKTVARLANEGHLPCWTVPHSKHRRFARAEVEAFRQRHGIPALVGDGENKGT